MVGSDCLWVLLCFGSLSYFLILLLQMVRFMFRLRLVIDGHILFSVCLTSFQSIDNSWSEFAPKKSSGLSSLLCPLAISFFFSYSSCYLFHTHALRNCIYAPIFFLSFFFSLHSYRFLTSRTLEGDVYQSSDQWCLKLKPFFELNTKAPRS